jgi:hypothetical protein
MDFSILSSATRGGGLSVFVCPFWVVSFWYLVEHLPSGAKSEKSEGRRGLNNGRGGTPPIRMERVCKWLKRMMMSWRHRGKECGTIRKQRDYRKWRSFNSRGDSTVLTG